MPTTFPLASMQQARLERFAATRAVDVHCHVLPDVDDGPRDLTEALAVCRALVHDGITDVIATPHQLGRWDGTNHASAIRAAVTEMQSRLDVAKIPLTLHPGGEVRLDERIPQLLGAGKILTLADMGMYLLLELPQGLSIEPSLLIPYLTRTGVRIVLAHAERYNSLTSGGDPVRSAQPWIAQGVAFQVNATSLVGNSGEQAEMAAWQWLEAGLVSIVATDAHSNNSRRPYMTAAIDQIASRLGDDVARRVCIENPLRVVEGRELV
jgi:protein-tyrosine phosphatase